jgi:hypothetical protein
MLAWYSSVEGRGRTGQPLRALLLSSGIEGEAAILDLRAAWWGSGKGLVGIKCGQEARAGYTGP